ncbi:MAG: hypothetical protein AAB359_04480, partial [Elusimicrobiota bacterium]
HASGIYMARHLLFYLKTFLFSLATVCFLSLSGTGLLLAAEGSQANNPPTAGNWALGGLYPGASLKYVTNSKTAWELRAQSGSGVFALGPRYYRYFIQASNPRLFFGIEADYLTFKGKVSKSTGYAGGAFVGGEVFLTKQLGLLLDFGPMYISLEDDKFSESASNIEYVMNMGVYWHFK